MRISDWSSDVCSSDLVHELREHSLWSEGQVWCSPERHGQITGIMKTQIDHLPLAYKGLRPTQGRTLAVMQVSAGSQSFNSVRSEEHTSELQSLMRISYAVFCLKTKTYPLNSKQIT